MTKNPQKSPKKYFCEICDYSTSNIKDFNKHLATRKHKMLTIVDTKIPKNQLFVCDCGKQYKHRQSLSLHKKTCTFIENSKQIFNENQEMKKMLSDVCDKINNIEPSSIINNNNQLNINVFLNDNCKDALNLTDFVNSLQLKLKDLEITGKLGYAEGVSQIFKNGLNSLELTKRPIHCTKNNENIYVKENNIWDKEKHDNPYIKKAIEDIGKNNFKQIPNWVDENPQCKNNGTKKNSQYIQILENSIVNNEQDLDKIIENIKNEVIIQD